MLKTYKMKAFQKNSLKAIMIFLLGSVLLTACKKDSESESSDNPVADAIDPGQGKGGDVLSLKGSGLAGMTSIMFAKDSVPAGFNPNFNTNTAVIFRIPDTASGGMQDIILTNRLGKQVKVSFNVVALPSITTASDFNFAPGVPITLTGNNLQEVSEVKLTGTALTATIISKSKKQLVISFPETSALSTTLDITNTTGVMTTTQAFVNLALTYQMFTEDYAPGWSGNFWGAGSISTDYAVSGTKSLKLTYAKGNWSANGVANWSPGLNYSADYKFLSFYIKGGSVAYTLYITGDKRAGGYGNSDDTAPIVVPPLVWTYYKIPLSSLNLWAKGSNFNTLGFWIKGPDSRDETFYVDDLVFVK
jgi:hypothetical protein